MSDRRTDEPLRAFAHIGLQKTGTSFLQSYTRDNPDAIRAMGVDPVPPKRGQAVVDMREVRQHSLQDDGELSPGLRRLRDMVSASQAPTVLFSIESVVGATEEGMAKFVSCFEGRELHLMLTVRDLARVLPSAWQQGVKGNRYDSFADFLDLVQHGERGRGSFWHMQDIGQIVERWSRYVDPSRIHVVTVPPAGSDPQILAERVGSLTGIDFASLTLSTARPNHSLDAAQTELVRRLHGRLELEDRRAFLMTIHRFLAAEILGPRRGRSTRTPERHATWCREIAEAQISALSAAGVDVIGSLEDLRPSDASFGPDRTEPSEEEVAEVAVTALSDILRHHHERNREVNQLRRQLKRARRRANRAKRAQAGPSAGPATSASVPRRAARRARRVLGRVKRRVSPRR